MSNRLLYELLENDFQPTYNFKIFLKATATAAPLLKEYFSKKRNIIQAVSLFKHRNKLIRGLSQAAIKRLKRST